MNWVTRLFGQSGTGTRTTQKTKTKSKSPQCAAVRHPFQAVSIYSTQLEPCRAAQQISGAYFLAQQAPSLPLANCPRPDRCSCRYRHHEDRRQDSRRDSDVGLPQRQPIDHERRAGRDRRAN